MIFGDDDELSELDSYVNEVSDISDTDDIDSDFTIDNFDAEPTTPAAANADPAKDPASVEPVAQDQQQAKDPAATPADPNAADPNAAAKPNVRPIAGGAFADDKGNITDKDGNIIAKRGFAARIHQQNSRMRDQIQQADNQVRQLSEQLGNYQALNNASQSYGLDVNEMAKAIDFAGRMKKGDILGVTKDVLAMALEAGHNVSDILGNDVGDSVEMRALRGMVDEIKAPQLQQQQREQQEQQIRETAQANYQSFVRDNYNAELHANEIASIMKTSGMNPQQAYNSLVQSVQKSGMDFNKPLRPQIEARVLQNRQQQADPNATQQQSAKPMPNGAETRTPGVDRSASTPMASADDTWSSIIGQVI